MDKSIGRESAYQLQPSDTKAPNTITQLQNDKQIVLQGTFDRQAIYTPQFNVTVKVSFCVDVSV